MKKKPVTLIDRVFVLLREKGPLDVTQICIELGFALQVNEVVSALHHLQTLGAAQKRPDPSREVSDDELLVVWGLPIPTL